MADNPLFGLGFPGPTVTAQEIDSLPSRIAQSRGAMLGAQQRASGVIDSQLEPIRRVADNAVGTVLEPVEMALSHAGQTAAAAVVAGQVATVKALQQPLTTAVKYGYASQGTPILSPTGKKTKPKKPTTAAQAAPSVPVGAAQTATPAPVGAAQAAPPAPVDVSRTWTIFFQCLSRQVAALDDGQLTGQYVGWRPPPPWGGGDGFQGTQAQLTAYLQQYGQQMFANACPHYVPPG